MLLSLRIEEFVPVSNIFKVHITIGRRPASYSILRIVHQDTSVHAVTMASLRELIGSNLHIATRMNFYLCISPSWKVKGVYVQANSHQRCWCLTVITTGSSTACLLCVRESVHDAMKGAGDDIASYYFIASRYRFPYCIQPEELRASLLALLLSTVVEST